MSEEKTSVTSENDNEVIQFSGFYIGDTLCGVDIDIVQEINDDLTITKVPLAPDYVFGIMNLRGQIVTIIDQSKKIGFKKSEIGKKSRVIIISSKEEHIGLLVDRIAEVVMAEKKEIADPPSNIHGIQGKYFSGILHTKQGELMAILDVETMVSDRN